MNHLAQTTTSPYPKANTLCEAAKEPETSSTRTNHASYLNHKEATAIDESDHTITIKLRERSVTSIEGGEIATTPTDSYREKLPDDSKILPELPASSEEIIPFKTPGKDEIDMRRWKGVNMLKMSRMIRLYEALSEKSLAEAITAISHFVPKRGSIADIEFVLPMESRYCFEGKRTDTRYLASPLHVAAGRASCTLVGILARQHLLSRW